MKCFAGLVFLLLTTQYTVAQKVLIPYRSGKLWGLCDEKKKIVCKPAYDEVQWIKHAWFRTTRVSEEKDSTQTTLQQYRLPMPGRALVSTGLINNGKVILDSQPFDRYDIEYSKYIIARSEGRSSQLTRAQLKARGNRKSFFCLFNMKGQQMTVDSFLMIRPVDTAGSRYTLFWVVNLGSKQSLIVYDALRQQISDELITNAGKLAFGLDKFSTQQKIVVATDLNGAETAYLIDNSSGKFTLKPTTVAEVNALTKSGNRGNGKGVGNGHGRDDGIREVDSYGTMDVAVPEPESIPIKEPKPVPFPAYFSRINDSLYYTAQKGAFKRVSLPEGAKVIFMETPGMTQYQPVIVKHEQRFYIVSADQFGGMAYDSLIYFGRYFLAWKKVNGQTKAGVISSTDSMVVPFVYDSLCAGIRYAEIVSTARSQEYKLTFKEADSKYNYRQTPYKRSYTNYVTVFANGRCGVVTLSGDTIVPIRYQMIARNGIEHSMPRKSDFVLLQQNNLYGLTSLTYHTAKKHEIMSSTVEPSFQHMPVFFYQDYYGVKGYRLIGLWNDQMQMVGYGNEKGAVFYEGE